MDVTLDDVVKVAAKLLKSVPNGIVSVIVPEPKLAAEVSHGKLYDVKT